MIDYTTDIFIICRYSSTNIRTLKNCPGVSVDSAEDLPWKLNASSIVEYEIVTEVNGNTITLKVSCVLRGQFRESTIQLNQVLNVNNLGECHYLTVNKDFIVSLESSKTRTADKKNSYQLMNLEEIEVNSNSLTKFLDDECTNEDDYGIPMTILYTDVNKKCGKFQAICNENSKTPILSLNYSPLTKTSTFIGGIKYPLGISKMDESECEMISDEWNVPAGDQSF